MLTGDIGALLVILKESMNPNPRSYFGGNFGLQHLGSALLQARLVGRYGMKHKNTSFSSSGKQNPLSYVRITWLVLLVRSRCRIQQGFGKAVQLH